MGRHWDKPGYLYHPDWFPFKHFYAFQASFFQASQLHKQLY